MKVLLRLLRPGPDGGVEYQDTELSSEQLSLGSAPDCTIQLLGENVIAHHATLRAAGRSWTVSCSRGSTVTVNGRRTASANVGVSDLIEIGGHRLRLIDAPQGFDLGIELETDTQVAPSA